MKIERQREELARIEGIWKDDIPVYDGCFSGRPMKQVGVRCSTLNELPTYESIDELHRIIVAMDTPACQRYWQFLIHITGGGYVDLAKTTPAQIREAILLAYGKWERE